jgi:hypothetical protein
VALPLFITQSDKAENNDQHLKISAPHEVFFLNFVRTLQSPEPAPKSTMAVLQHFATVATVVGGKSSNGRNKMASLRPLRPAESSVRGERRMVRWRALRINETLERDSKHDDSL